MRPSISVDIAAPIEYAILHSDEKPLHGAQPYMVRRENARNRRVDGNSPREPMARREGSAMYLQARRGTRNLAYRTEHFQQLESHKSQRGATRIGLFR